MDQRFIGGGADRRVKMTGFTTIRSLGLSLIVALSLLVGCARDAQGPTDEERRLIAGDLGGRKVDLAKITDARSMPNQCSTHPAIANLSASPSWNGWSPDTENTRFQPAQAAGLVVAQVPRLRLKWAFGFPAAEAMWGQPTIAAGRIFIGVDTGAVYSLDATTGCVHWSFQAEKGVRNAISIGPVKGHSSAKYAIYFGDMKANVYAVNAVNGELLWRTKVEDHPLALITGAPKLYGNRLYVPVSSTEEVEGGMVSYPCCSFRGSVVALDADTGRQVWKTYIISETPKPVRKNSKGVQLWAPAGGAVWNSPTIDARRHAIYIGTGNSYNEPVAKTIDAVMALDMYGGRVLWSVQDTDNDASVDDCAEQNASENCPKDLGPDFDFGSSPILRTLPGGRRILVAGQKNGMVWGHDPDRRGIVIWKAQLVEKLAQDMIVFGGAADEENAYFGLGSGGVVAVQLKSGDRQWFAPVPASQAQGSRGGETAALTAIPGVVFSGGRDGVVRAFSTSDGRLLWQYSTLRVFTTVNGVAAHGGSMGAPGPTVAGGMLFVGSGYRWGNKGNVLLAFSPN